MAGIGTAHRGAVPRYLSANVDRVATGTEHVTSQILDYVLTHSSPPDPLLSDLRAETARRFRTGSPCRSAPSRAFHDAAEPGWPEPRRAVEVGTFTGYSAICLARGLAPGGRLLCCDVNAEWTALARDTGARPAWRPDRAAARPGHRHAARAARGRAVRPGLHRRGQDRLPQLLGGDRAAHRSGGIILVDNTFLHGRISPDPDPDARAVRDFNEQVIADDRVELAMLSIGDGVIFARKK